jgi:hypothetical protein
MSPSVATICPKCGFQHPAATEVCAKCGVIFARFFPAKPRVDAAEPAPTKGGFEHATAVLQFKEKGFAVSRKDLLEGLDEESARHLAQLGRAGWELVSAVPFSSGGASLSFTGSIAKTDAVLAFFKRALSTREAADKTLSA